MTTNAAQHYANLAERLLSETGIDIEFWQCGLEVLHSDQYRTAQQWCQAHGLDWQTKQVPSNNSVIQQLHSRKSGGYLSSVAQIRSPRLIKAMITYLVQRGVDLLPDTELIDCVIEKNRITGIHTSRGYIRTNKLVWATGAWAQQLRCENQPITPPHVAPIRGQILAFEGKNVGLDTIIYNDGHYLIPRKDGLILAGSTLEDVGFDNSITAKALKELQQKSVALLPALSDCEIVHQWSGLRPASPDNIPTIGPHPHIEELYFNCGHFRYGIAMAPQSAKIVADWILQPKDSSLNSTYQPKNTPV